MSPCPKHALSYISLTEVRPTFIRVNSWKIASLDEVPRWVVESSTDQLATAFTDFLIPSLEQSIVPICCKATIIIPVPM